MGILLLIVFLILFGFITGFLPLSSSFGKGAEGEHLLFRRLQGFEGEGGAKILSNVYIPAINGGTTEIDLLLIHPKGLFAFENKNFSGWIFGNEKHQNWTQTLPGGRNGGVNKVRFYNPILQNASHIKHLMYRIEKRAPVWSIIIFSDECELKDITVISKNVRVGYSRYAASIVDEICHETRSNALTPVEIINLYNYLATYADVSVEEKEAHGQRVFKANRRP